MVRVQMINAQGLDEAGIDGGGVFRFVVCCLFLLFFCGEIHIES